MKLSRFPSVVTLDHAIRDDPYLTSRKSSLKLIKLSSINKVSFSLGFLLSVNGLVDASIFP